MKSILQSESNECGLACLAMVANYFGYKISLPDLRRKFSISLRGADVTKIVRHAAEINLSARALRVDLDEIEKLKLPSILHWNLNHFVVLKKIRIMFSGKRKFVLLDPAVGEVAVTEEQFSAKFSGVALEFIPTEKFEKRIVSKRLSIRLLTGRVVGLKSALAQIIILAAVLEVFAILSPLFNQFVIDDVIVGGDKELLKILTLGFALLLLTQTAISLARSWLIMRWSMDISFQWSSRIFSHLIRLPVNFFERRHLGDVVSRFSSMSAIQSTLTTLFVESFLDGVMAMLALCMMFLYSWKLSLVSIFGVLIYILMRALFYHPLREASRERIILSAKENSNFIETIRAITPLKLFGRESERLTIWQNYKQDVLNRDVKTQKLGILFKIGNTVIGGVQMLTTLYIGSGLVMDNQLTVGMLMAFTSYSGTFGGRMFGLVDAYINTKLLSMHADRLADIVLEPTEEDIVPKVEVHKIVPNLTLRNIKFRYSDSEPFILNNINLTIPFGESLVITGPSGSGKSTLCKIILGLVSPTEGEILIGDIPLSQIGLRSYRQMIGSVTQDDLLLAGSIFDNISFFDGNNDIVAVERAATLAVMHEEISVMVMGYQTLVGDMGSSLSGGQKQRILLARAIYKNPSLLMLDEATSHLDVHNELRVTKNLSLLPMTRIMIAHRPETIKSAERVIAIHAGTAIPVHIAN